MKLKSEDKTKIFSKMPANQATDFFLNYPSLGIDILFDGLTKVDRNVFTCALHSETTVGYLKSHCQYYTPMHVFSAYQ